MRVPTVKIKADTTLGYMLINESDFNPNLHKIFKLESEVVPTPSAPPVPEVHDDDDILEIKARRGRPPKLEISSELSTIHD